MAGLKILNPLVKQWADNLLFWGYNIHMMKRIISLSFLISTLVLTAFHSFAQAPASTPASPLQETEGSMEDAQIKIVYSSPAVKGRVIWDGLVPYNKVWRTGANEATTFETDQDIYLQSGEVLPAGKYALFTIPGESEWTWIFNAEWSQWGAFKYNEEKDVIRIKATPEASPVFYERMTFLIEDNVISLNWENLRIKIE